MFHFLEKTIRNQGDLLYTGLVNAAIPVIVWILCGGSRRNNAVPSPQTSIIVNHTSEQTSTPPSPLPFKRNVISR